MTDTLTRTAASTTVPAAGTYSIDPAHSSASFRVRHLGLSKVRGRFESFRGAIEVAEDPFASSVEVTIDAASFSTGDAGRDTHVKSPDFLDVEAFPTLSFASTAVRQDGDSWLVDGHLTVRDQTRPVTLVVSFEGAGTDPWGGRRIAFSATTTIDREDFGLTWNQALETGGVLIGKTVHISIDLEAIVQA